MERSKVKDLEKWYKSKFRKPLVLWGARQIGKTYLVKEYSCGCGYTFLHKEVINFTV